MIFYDIYLIYQFKLTGVPREHDKGNLLFCEGADMEMNNKWSISCF